MSTQMHISANRDPGMPVKETKNSCVTAGLQHHINHSNSSSWDIRIVVEVLTLCTLSLAKKTPATGMIKHASFRLTLTRKAPC